MQKLKKVAYDILEEAKCEEFRYDKNKKIIKDMVECLTSQRHIMTYEFKESGLLEAL